MNQMNQSCENRKIQKILLSYVNQRNLQSCVNQMNHRSCENQKIQRIQIDGGLTHEIESPLS